MYKELRFDWDENKNRINRKKHHVSFEEACEAAIKYCLENLIRYGIYQ